MTKLEYSELLEDTLILAQQRFKNERTTLWNGVINQLIDIREHVVDNYDFGDWEEVHDRYTIGTLAARQLEESDDMQKRLFSIFWGAVHWKELND